jgi:hypothetical protein
MTWPFVLPVTKRKRGNPTWGKPLQRIPVLRTEFEMQVERLELTRAQYANSAELKHWCERNRNRVYIPEWLLDEWGMIVETIFSGVA